MDDAFSNPDRVGIRAFEDTAIKKLLYMGVPSAVAQAFVRQGVPKSQNFEAVKRIVCKMKYTKLFTERSEADYRDPLRVGAMISVAEESKKRRFHAEFAMSELEATRFISCFPEFEMILKGRTYNQHAFYANKRYAETELLVHTIYCDAASTGADPTSIVDLGGNQGWHTKRNRPGVHCDNPVLSPRDSMRYTVREIFSGEDVSKACRKRFQECGHKATYGMAVHATYDLTPKDIAIAMSARSMVKFYGVMNYIPGLESKPPGRYESDGLVFVVGAETKTGGRSLKCSFKHDPSLEYLHDTGILKSYLFAKDQIDFYDDDREHVSYQYKIDSYRSNTMFFSITKVKVPRLSVFQPWTPPSSRLYYLSLRTLGLDRMEIDSEFFDRLVLQAAGARDFSRYDIVSLYRYAKSLRQRVSINGMVLSSGYTQTPEQLMYATIAAFAVVAAYDVESKDYFRKASRQIVNLRGTTFLRDVVSLTASAVSQAFVIPLRTMGDLTGARTLRDRLLAAVSNKSGVTVEVYKPHAGGGLTYNSHTIPSFEKLSGYAKLRSTFGQLPTFPTDNYDALRATRAKVGSSNCNFMSAGLWRMDKAELPRDTPSPVYYDMSGVSLPRSAVLPLLARTFDVECLRLMGLSKEVAKGMVQLRNGDRLYPLSDGPLADPNGRVRGGTAVFPMDTDVYYVFRGVGDKAVVLKPPVNYSRGMCLGLVILYRSYVDVDDVREFRSARHGYQNRRSTGTEETSGRAGAGGPEAELRSDGHGGSADEEPVDVGRGESFAFQPDTSDAGASFVGDAARRGAYYMSGALGPGESALEPAGSESDSTDAVAPDVSGGLPPHEQSTVTTLEGVELAANTGPMVEGDTAEVSTSYSDEAIPGRAAIYEYLKVCSRSEDTARASARLMINLCVSVVHGVAKPENWTTMAMGMPGNPIPVRVTGDGDWEHLFSGEEVRHMAVSDGKVVYDRNVEVPPPGLYVTSDEMLVYTGGAIRQSLESVLETSYSCPVTCVNGVAGSGKSHSIVHSAKPGDVVLCETRESLRDVAKGLEKLEGWQGHCYTVDSFLIHRQVDRCATLWVDEAFRLHAAKMFGLMKILKPEKVFCFGDDKQIPALPFVPAMDFEYHVFPFLSVELKTDSWRIPADVAFALSRSEYYSSHVTTHNPVMRSLGDPVLFVPGTLADRPEGSPLLVFTKSCKHDLVKQGLKDVYTVGEAQGKTFDHVTLFRDSELRKELYSSFFQALVAVTRHRRSFRYVTVCGVAGDESAVAKLLDYVRRRASDVLLASHQVPGVRAARDAGALAARGSGADEVGGGPSWASIMEDAEDLGSEDWDMEMNRDNSSIGS